MLIPEKSPLYDPGYSPEIRREMQERNFAAILDAVEAYDPISWCDYLPIEDLIVNGKEQPTSKLKIIKSPKRGIRGEYMECLFLHLTSANGNYARLIMEAQMPVRELFERDQDLTPFWFIYGKVNTREGYEGNGFGTALVHASDLLLPIWASILPSDPSRVVALRFDTSIGAEEKEGKEAVNGYRDGWATTTIDSLQGYSNTNEAIIHYLGEITAEPLMNGRTWVRSLRE